MPLPLRDFVVVPVTPVGKQEDADSASKDIANPKETASTRTREQHLVDFATILVVAVLEASCHGSDRSSVAAVAVDDGSAASSLLRMIRGCYRP
mmetsp:Transcript_19054/g.52215  ORF Transcript_19054/g.52215 Transcript_19054/m.52215 type:complete len:94 (+) Transcript_19054:2320-2601(+)